MNTYQTVQGDMWDSIAKQAYGTETAMDQLMRANPDLLQVAVFGAGEIVLLPQISAQEAASTAVPPWRK
jgi:phage tail protein X